MDILKFLLLREEYEKYVKDFPYCFEVRRGGKSLYYFGSNHCHTPGDPMFGQLKGYFNSFIQETGNKDCIVLVEGMVRENVDANENKAIQNGGEGDYITLLANRVGTPTDCPEPNEYEIMQHLIGSFSKLHIYLYRFVSLAEQWHRYPEQPDFQEYIESYLRKDKASLGWDDFVFSYRAIISTFAKELGKEFNLSDTEYFNSLSNPNESSTVVNRVARASSDVRDAAIVQSIQEYWNQGKNIFVVYGGSHAIIQEPALKSLLV